MSATCDGRHVCEPPYPVSEGAVWDCPECGRRYAATRIGDMPNMERTLSGPLGKHIDPRAFGWTSPAVRS